MNAVERALATANHYQIALRELLFHAAAEITDEERQERVQLLSHTLRLYLPFAMLVVLVNVLISAINGTFWNSLLVNLPGLLLAFIIERLTHYHNYRLLIWLPPLMGIPLIYLLALQFGSPYLFLFVLVIFPIYGAALLYTRVTILLSFLSIGSLALFYILLPYTMSFQVFAQWFAVFFLIETLLIFFSAYMLSLETREKQSIQKQRRLDVMRDFIRNVSHDFRTPLTVIQSSAYLLKRYDDPLKREKQAEQIDRMVARMEEMLNNTVLLSRLQTSYKLRQDRISFSELFAVLMPKYAKLAEEKGIHFQAEAAQTLPELEGDAELLLAVLRHMLDNAFRYTDVGGEVWLAAQEAKQNITITIADTGIGIPADQLERIFEPMYRTDAARTTDTGGTGIGLTIAQLAVELHGGTIHVTSQEGVGSQFAIQLPLPRIESNPVRRWFGSTK